MVNLSRKKGTLWRERLKELGRIQMNNKKDLRSDIDSENT